MIVDDVVSSGGTFAALRSYIIRNGGTVVFTTALAHKIGQNHSILLETVNTLRSLYGPELDNLWTQTIGHGIERVSLSQRVYSSRSGQMRSKAKAAHAEPRCYSDSEIPLMRRQVRTGKAVAKTILTEEKYPLDPRIADARKRSGKAE